MRRAPHIGTVADYAACFRRLPLLDHERAMLVGHASAGALSMTEIARAGGWSSFRAGNRRYGELARKVRDDIGLAAGRSDSGEPLHVLSLFDAVGRDGRGHHVLRLHDEVVEGMRHAGLIA